MSEITKVDPKRTGVKASMIPCEFPPMHYSENNRLHGPHGAFITCEKTGPDGWILCCPGCGQAGSPRDGAHWQYVSGTFDDVTTLTLTPSIANGCCGWHGYLKNGVFESV